ncbi:YfiR family protein [Litoribrevibacter euphylliae]|uniref:YfiR family protein n=1 Tax=Litoribrevibacter euphylliae TaxID=1834034 RepID=A0ABV7H9J5_9GAMM
MSLFFSKSSPLKLLFTWIACLWILHPIPSHAETIDKKKLLKIEAAYLYKFTKFIKWPDRLFNQSSNLNICLVGSNLDALNRLLTKGVSGKQSNGRTLRIYYYQTDHPSTNEHNCHLIYLDQHASNSLTTNLDFPSTLLISAPNHKHKKDSLIYLEILNGKLVFFINQNHLDTSELEINAALLSLARKRL